MFTLYIYIYIYIYSHTHTAQQAGRSRVRFPMVSLEFFIDIILPPALWPLGWSTSNRNEYQEYLLGGKGGRCVGLTTLPPSCADCLEICLYNRASSEHVSTRNRSRCTHCVHGPATGPEEVDSFVGEFRFHGNSRFRGVQCGNHCLVHVLFA